VWPVLLIGAIVAAVIITDLIDFGTDDLRIGLLNANVDTSWSHRATAVALAVGAGVALLRAARSPDRRAWWGGTGVVLILLFMTEASPLHVQVDRLTAGKLIYAPLLVVLLVSVVYLAGSSDHAQVMRAGLAALVASYAIHLLGMPAMHALGWGADTWGYQTRASLKEGTELGGWLLVVLALSRSAGVRRGRGMKNANPPET